MTEATHHTESLGDLAKKHPAGTAAVVIGGVFLLLRLRKSASLGGSNIPVPMDTGLPNYSAVGGQGGVSGPTPDQTGAALGAIEQQIQAIQSAALQHSQASGQVAPPLNYDPSRGAFAGTIPADLGLWSAQSAQTLPDACNYSRCKGIFGCIGHFFTTTATCGWRIVQTAGLGLGQYAAPLVPGLAAGAAGLPGQIPGAVSGYPGYNGPQGSYGGYGYYTPGIAPSGSYVPLGGPSISYGGGASIVPAYPAPAQGYSVSTPIYP